MATGDSTTDLNVEILDSMAELVAAMLLRAEDVAQRHGVPIFFLKVFHRLDCPMAMKELGQRMRCDPSFVTNIADQLEKRGLATRESDPADRRVKRIALTPAGMELKQRIETEILNGLPWRHALDNDERACLLGLVRKLLSATQAGSGPSHEAHDGAAQHGEEVNKVLVSSPVTGVDS
ncbi:MAG TPA: MarR family transcriptional regulator [Streptosporangiaceae bacterium]|nr:MarR family transcriptional regulator [Streptosporangiaceae bacterium]